MSIWFAAPVENWPHYNTRTMTIVSATNADSNYPATNLFTYDPTQVFRTTSGSTVITVNIQGNGVGYPDFDVIGLLFTNTSYRATLTVELSDGGVSWTTIKNGGPLWANLTGTQPTNPPNPPGLSDDPRFYSIKRNHALINKGNTTNYTHARFTISDPLVTNITIGRVFFGKRFIPTYGMQYESSVNFNDFGRADRTERGVLTLEPGRAVTAWQVKQDFLTKVEMYDYVFNFNLFLGASREFLACLDDTDTARLQKNLTYCTISQGRTVSFDAYNIHSQTWVLESIA